VKRVVLACAFAGAVAAQQPPVVQQPAVQQPAVQQPAVQQPVYVTAIEVVADVRDADGNVPTNLTAADFVIVEQGVERPVIGVDYFSAGLGGASASAQAPGPAGSARPAVEPPGWQIVLFFDRYLSSASTLRGAADALLERADELAKLGQVSVVVSSPDPNFLVLDTRDPEVIRKALREVKGTSAVNWLVRHRRQYQYRSDMARARPIFTELSAMAQARELPEFIRGEIMAEVEAVGRFQSALLTSIGRFPRRTPRALFIISEGFELDSAAYYEQFATDLEDIRRIRQSPLELNVGANTDAIARMLAASGWTTIGVHAGLGAGEQWIDDASRSSIGRVSAPRAREALHASERANEPLLAFANETGGSAGTAGMIAGSVARLDQAVVLTYQVSRPPDGTPRSIEVKSRRPGLSIKAFRWATESTPSEVAATRTLALLSDTPVVGGDLPTTVRVAWTGRIGPRREGEIVVSCDLAALAPVLVDRQTVFRATIVVSRKNFPPTIVHRTVTPRNLGSTFEIKVPIEAGDEKLDVAASVEELTTGLWGGGKASLPARMANARNPE
jgi:hypothetical protein